MFVWIVKNQDVRDQDKNMLLICIEKLHLYKVIIKDLMYRKQWQEIIKNELLNL